VSLSPGVVVSRFVGMGDGLLNMVVVLMELGGCVWVWVRDGGLRVGREKGRVGRDELQQKHAGCIDLGIRLL
jgi:hypothetical protein